MIIMMTPRTTSIDSMRTRFPGTASAIADLAAIQSALRERNIDAWLFYDHHHRDPIAYRVLGLPAGLMVTRRWFYLIPAQGEPVKLVHKIEAGHLDSLPGSKRSEERRV